MSSARETSILSRLEGQVAGGRQELRRSEELLQLALEASRMGAWDYDPIADRVFWDARTRELFGVDPDEEIRYDKVVRGVVHPEDRDRVDAAAQGAFDPAGDGVYDVEHRVLHPDGSVRWLAVRGRAFFSGGGSNSGPRRAVRLLGIVHDVTAAKQAEQTLREADRRKDQFLATLAHELRNPLNPVRTALQLLRLTYGDRDSFDRTIQMMERQVGQMVRLIDDLMDISRITRDKVSVRKERVELAAVLHNALEMSRPLIEARRHELTVELPPAPLHLEADASRLSQVFANLLNNAAKYTEPGGRIWLTAQRDGEQAVVRVRDNGIGIPPDRLAQIFEPFIQVDSSLERSQGGLGIGLTLVQRLLELHGGTVEAQSAGLGHGSELVVRLPVLDRPEDGPPR